MDEDLKKKLIKYSIIGFVALIVLVILLAIFVSSKGGSTNVETTSKEIKLVSGDQYNLENVSDYTWDSTDKSVAIVSDNGKIEALKEGDTTITITEGKKVTKYVVHVEKIDESINLKGVKMFSNTIEINQGENYKMSVNLIPSNATNTELTWYSSNLNVATVENGVITGVGSGICVVTVKSSNGNVDNCLVKVKGSAHQDDTPIEDIVFHATSIVLKKDILYTLDYEVLPSESSNEILWTVGDNTVLNIENGMIETIGVGTTSVIATSGDVSREIYVTVVEGDSDTPDVIYDGKEVLATSIVLNIEDLSLEIGETYQLLYELLPFNTTDKTVTWSSYDDSVAEVDDAGTVIARREGVTIITAATKDISATCLVTVKGEGQDGGGSNSEYEVKMNMENSVLNVSETVQLSLEISPANYESTIEWTSEDPSIASVDSEGLVTAVSEGTTTITATLESGESASCNVSVSSSIIRVYLIKLNVEKISLKVGGTTQLSATILPSNATNKTITWSSSNSNVASVDKNGKVTAKAEGTAVITAKSINGVTAKASVVVVPKEGVFSLNKTTMTLKAGETGQLTLSGVSASDKGKVSWKTSDSSVATVDYTGKVTARKNGTATITATLNSKTVSCKVTVSGS